MFKVKGLVCTYTTVTTAFLGKANVSINSTIEEAGGPEEKSIAANCTYLMVKTRRLWRNKFSEHISSKILAGKRVSSVRLNHATFVIGSSNMWYSTALDLTNKTSINVHGMRQDACLLINDHIKLRSNCAKVIQNVCIIL